MWPLIAVDALIAADIETLAAADIEMLAAADIEVLAAAIFSASGSLSVLCSESVLGSHPAPRRTKKQEAKPVFIKARVLVMARTITTPAQSCG